jgi:uncharacterized protein YfaS (alpha-2-macroglobulin family)
MKRNFVWRSTFSVQRIFVFLAMLIFVSLACSLPPQPETEEAPPTRQAPAAAPAEIDDLPPTPTLPPPPTPTAQPLPPTLVEAEPAPGSAIPLKSALTFYFNQPMDRGSVEGALVGEPGLSGRLQWVDDATLVFEPDTALPPATDLTVELGTTALAANGLALQEPIRLSYRTAPRFQAIQVLPEPDTVEADPGSAIVATFDQPVVPLGADPNTLPAAFSIEPAVTGDGEWINTSTYIFYPDPHLYGGTTYNVTLNRDLRSSAGAPLVGIADTQGQYYWTFSTALPQMLSVTPEEGATSVPLDSTVEISFNQAMDPDSVQENFSFLAPGGIPVEGILGWNDDFTTLVFTPTNLLARDTGYFIKLLGQAQSSGGTALGSDHQHRVFTVPPLYVSWTEPDQGGILPNYQGPKFHFSAPIDRDAPLKYVSVSPSVTNLYFWTTNADYSLSVNGDFKPNTEYLVTVSGSLPDRWGGTLGNETILRFRTAPMRPTLQVAYGESQLFITPQDTNLSAQAASINSVELAVGSIAPSQFWQYLGPNGFDTLNSYFPPDAQLWMQPLDVSTSKLTTVQLGLTPDGSSLPPGLYHYRAISYELESPARPFLIVSSHVHLTFKLSSTQAFIWALDLRDNTPVADAPITIYDANGNSLASGFTDTGGVFQAPIPAKPDVYGNFYAVLGNPGDGYFSLASSAWNSGLQGFEYGIATDYGGPRTRAYIYTDRPIYRPGQTVNFRAIVRHARNGRYAMPDIGILPVEITDGNYQPVFNEELPLSEYGTAHSEFTLADEAPPGYYQINTPHGMVSFQVAEYRKPEIDLQVMASPDQMVAGENITAQVNARYFFDAPAGNVPLSWTVNAFPEYISLPGYQVGVDNYGWMRGHPPVVGGYYPYGMLISSGEGKTGSDGLLTIEIPTDPEITTQRFVIEVTVQDESGFPFSNQAEVIVHPAEFYIGVRPDTWVGVAEDEISFDVKVVDWERKSAGSLELSAVFRKIVWVRDEKTDIYSYPTYTPEYTSVSSANFRTGEDGLARLAFTPPEPGTYELAINGDGAVTNATIWVGGEGQVSWPNLPNQQITLTADRQKYAPGDIAQVFIPNPLGAGVQALVTVERGEVLRHQVIVIEGNGYTLELPLTGDDAPNVYVAVTLIGPGLLGKFDFRQGFINLDVEPVEQVLNVTLIPLPDRAGPQDEVSFTVRVTNETGYPLQGEFSLAIVDKAVLALADPFEPGIVEAFYGTQPLGVRTGLSLAAYAHRFTDMPGGLGGGGGGDIIVPSVREEFPDTAYWNANIVTNAAGEAVITLKLPDNLTTWVADTRGLTAETRVGATQAELVSTKDLLVRPVTPRFLVVGDHLRLMGIVHNNTANDLTVDVRLQATGFSLDDPSAATQNVAVPAGGRVSVAWWGTVEDVAAVDLIFFADGGGLSDATRPTRGDLPVLHYTAPQTFGTAGTLDVGGERLEIVSLPRTFDPSGGALRVELAPSLAAAMLPGLDVLEHYPYECTEQTLSRFLPNLEAFRAVQDLGLAAPDLEARLDRTLNEGIQRLVARQNEDGGWGWWSALTSEPSPVESGEVSDPYISAYVLFGLNRAREAGAFVDEGVTQAAVNFLIAAMPTPEMLSASWQLDRLAFQYFALAQAGMGNLSGVGMLYEGRSNLSPWAQAFLALTLETLSPGDPRIREIYSNLEANAIRTATGTHWEGSGARINMETPIFTTAVVIYGLAQHDPASPTIPEAVRYLMAARGSDGAWASTYETAWTIMSLTEVMKGTGELAGDFGFAASLNGIGLLEGSAGGDAKLNPVSASVPVSSLYPQDPNALSLQRGDGAGRLYYTAHLNVMRPVEDVAPRDQGINVERKYETVGGELLPTESGLQVPAGEPVIVKIAVTLKNDAYYLVVEDYVPAGSEILDTSLKTSQQFIGEPDPRNPFAIGWGWWYFNNPQVYDERIAWSVDYLPAGTYELTYTLVPNQPGEYRVLPARAWEFYFPEVLGHGAGGVFEIKE